MSAFEQTCVVVTVTGLIVLVAASIALVLM